MNVGKYYRNYDGLRINLNVYTLFSLIYYMYFLCVTSKIITVENIHDNTK